MNVVDPETADFLGEAAKDQREARSLARAARVVDAPRLRRNFMRQAKVFGGWCESRLWHVAQIERGLQ
jgi:hypothetical protein